MSHRNTIEEFVNKSHKIHGDKYDYSDVIYKNRFTKIRIKCPIHGNFLQRPYSHLEGKGCDACGKTHKLTTNTFISKANKVHNNKYDYSFTKYNGAHNKIVIICKNHGKFSQSAYSHLYGKGCPRCGGTKKLNTNEFIKKSILIHGKKYDYSSVDYKTNRDEVKIICPKHGMFFQKPNYHLIGEKCPRCSNRISKPECEFLDYLKLPNTKNCRQVLILNKQVDGFDNKTNTIYEFLGDYYHGNPKIYISDKYNPTCHKTFGELYENTNQRFKTLINKGYRIKYIWESDWKKYKIGIDNQPNIIEF